ncbi:Aspartate 1-decarboxylase [subsurface metagenome]
MKGVNPMRVMLKSKIHRARVTETNIDYEGSITIDKRLMEAADLLPSEQVHVLNINNGARFVTYTIEGDKGEICLNGAAARLVTKGDIVLVLSYCHVEDDEARKLVPKLVYVDEKNAITKIKQATVAAAL